MWDTLNSILPYTIGFIISPLPVIALILLLVGKNGFKRATIFEISWLIVSFTSIILLMMLIGATSEPPQNGETPAWQSAVILLFGIILLLVALITRTRIFRKKRAKKVRTPGWLRAIDRMSGWEITLIAIALVVFNPTNLSMVFAAAVNLANLSIPASQAVVPVIIFVLVGSLSVLIPYLLVAFFGKRIHAQLHMLRHWLASYGDRLSFWAAFGFAVVFLYKGLTGLF
jgi:hypothetical protein